MKDYYKTNSWLVLITFLLCFTFWGGIYALPILGLLRIIMSIKIAINFKALTKPTQTLFVIYVLTTVALIILIKFLEINQMTLLFGWMIISFLLAIFHLIITYKISKL